MEWFDVSSFVLAIISPILVVTLSVMMIFNKETMDKKEKLVDFLSGKLLIKIVIIIHMLITYLCNFALVTIKRANYNDVLEMYKEFVELLQPLSTNTSIPAKPFFKTPILEMIIINIIISLAAYLIIFLLIKYKYKKDMGLSLKEQMNAVMTNDSKMAPLKTLDCVFAVSAIAIKDNKFLLVKRQYSTGKRKWVQPGSFYRTNIVFSIGDEDDIQFGTVYSPYDYLIHQLVSEANICNEDQFKFLDFSGIGVLNSVNTSSFTNINITTGKNKLSPAPFLVQFEEKSTSKSSGKRIHIDLFYAIELQKNYSLEAAKQASFKEQVKYSEINLFSIEDIYNLVANSNEVYPDVYVVCNEFLKCYRKSKFNKPMIHTCCYDNNNKSILLLLGKKCNLSCFYCNYNTELDEFESGSIIPEGLIETVTRVIDERQVKQKIIISGGEPFKYEKCIEQIINIVQKKFFKIDEISIYTNGILWEPYAEKVKELNELCIKCHISLKLKLEISWFDYATFADITKKNTGYKIAEKFMDFLNINHILFGISVIMTKYFYNSMQEYVDFWNKFKIKNISLSFAYKSLEEMESRLLNKEECINCFNSLRSGKFQIENFDSLELLLPDCDNLNCNQGKNIKTVYYDSIASRWKDIEGCYEKIN